MGVATGEAGGLERSVTTDATDTVSSRALPLLEGRAVGSAPSVDCDLKGHCSNGTLGPGEERDDSALLGRRWMGACACGWGCS